MKPIAPHLWFDKEAKEAAESYCSVFPNSRCIRGGPVEGLTVRMKTTLIAATVAAATTLSAPASARAQVETQPFVPLLESHLEAVVAHDMDALLPTLTSGEELTMITPEGSRLSTKQEYIDFHRQWFAADDDQEELDIEIVSVVESSELSHALMRIQYAYTDPAGDEQDYVGWLTLTFALEDGRWGLVFDQNTEIQGQTGGQ